MQPPAQTPVLLVVPPTLPAPHPVESALGTGTGFTVLRVASFAEAEAALDRGVRPQVTLIDIASHGLRMILEARPYIQSRRFGAVAVFDRHASLDHARQAVAFGAAGYLPAGFKLMTEAIRALASGDGFIPSAFARVLMDGKTTAKTQLSLREVEVLEHVVAGVSVEVIARTLDITAHTVRMHMRSIRDKLASAPRAAA